MDKEELQAAVDAVPYWYHRIELPHGITTPGWAPLDAAAYRIPEDMSGALVLDVGAWDGYWSIEAARRGAERVLAIENFADTTGKLTNADRQPRWNNLLLCLNACDIRNVEMMEADIEDVSKTDPPIVNVVFCFGVLYHLKNPLLALENMRRMLAPGGTIHIETAILDGCQSAYGERGFDGDECCFEFYPGAEYGMNPSNWFVGTLRAWSAMVEAAGFSEIESWKLTDNPQSVSEARGFIKATA